MRKNDHERTKAKELKSSSSALLDGIIGAAKIAWRAAPASLAMYVVSGLATASAPVAAVWMTKYLLDTLTEPYKNASMNVLAPAIGLAIVGAAVPILFHANRYLCAELERASSLLAQDRLYGEVNQFTGLARFESPAFLDRLRLAEQAGGMTPSQLVEGVLSVLYGIFTTSGFLVSLAFVSFPLMFAVLLAAIPVLLAELALARRTARVLWNITPAERREQFYSSLLTNVQAVKEVRLFGLGDFFRKRMNAQRRATNLERRRLDRREFSVQAILGIASAAVAGAGIVLAVLAAGRGMLTAGDVAMLLTALVAVQAGLAGVIGELGDVRQQLLIFTHYQYVISAGPDLPPPARSRRVPALERGIEFRNVSFRYGDGDQWVLRDVNLRIPVGKTVALVGHNGAGKSTLAKLLVRLYDPSHGAVLWDGVDLRELPIAALRERIGAVFQDYMEYDLTAAENIGLGDLDLLNNRRCIEDAARRVGIHDDLASLPRGFDTMLTRIYTNEMDRRDPNTGLVLSGGQWQRLALARATLRQNRDLVILDEPTSGLDPQAEMQVYKSIAARGFASACLLISHRLAGIREADFIVVLNKGEVIEEGNHASLMASAGTYATLFSIQAHGYRSIEGPFPSSSARGVSA